MHSSSFVLQCFAALALVLSVSEASSDSFRKLGWKGGCCEDYRVQYNQCCVNGEVNTEAGCASWWSYKCPKGMDGFLAYKQCTKCSEAAEEPDSEQAAEAGTDYALSSNLQQNPVARSGLSTQDWILVGVAFFVGVIVLAIIARQIARHRQQSETNEINSKGSDDTSLEDVELSVPEFSVPVEASAPIEDSEH